MKVHRLFSVGLNNKSTLKSSWVKIVVKVIKLHYNVYFLLLLHLKNKWETILRLLVFILKVIICTHTSIFQLLIITFIRLIYLIYFDNVACNM